MHPLASRPRPLAPAIVCLVLVLLISMIPAARAAAQEHGGLAPASLDVGYPPDYEDRLAFDQVLGSAAQRVRELHGLDSRARVRAYAIDEVRAAALQTLLAMATAQEDGEIISVDGEALTDAATQRRALDYVSDALRERRVAAAQDARERYSQWYDRPCSYELPEGFERPDNPGCEERSPIGDTFVDARSYPPSVEQFLGWGQAAAYPGLYEAGSELNAAVSDGLEAYGLLAGIGAAAVTGSALAGAIGAGVTTTTAIASVTAPYATIVAGASTGLAATAAVGGVAIIAFALVASGFVIADAVEDAQIPHELDDAIAAAQDAGPDLVSLGTSEHGQAELWAVLVEHAPQYSSGTQARGHSAADPRWSSSMTTGPIEAIEVRTLDGWRLVSVRDGKLAVADPAAPSEWRWALHLDYLRAPGEPVRASVHRGELVVTPAEMGDEGELLLAPTDEAQTGEPQPVDELEFAEMRAGSAVGSGTAELIAPAATVTATWPGGSVAVSDGDTVTVPEGAPLAFAGHGEAIDWDWQWETTSGCGELEPGVCDSTSSDTDRIEPGPYLATRIFDTDLGDFTVFEGPWQVEATGQAADGTTSRIALEVAIENVAPELRGVTLAPLEAKASQPVVLEATVDDTDRWAAVDIDWGDGTRQRVFAADDGDLRAAHVYDAVDEAVERTIVVQARDRDGSEPGQHWSETVRVLPGSVTMLDDHTMSEDGSAVFPFEALWDHGPSAPEVSNYSLAVWSKSLTTDGESVYEHERCPDTISPGAVVPRACPPDGAHHGDADWVDDGLRYQPDPGWHGTETLRYAVCVGPAGDCEWVYESAAITVEPVNDPPTADDIELTVDEDQQVTVELADHASDPETSPADLAYAVADHPIATLAGTELTLTPPADWHGTETLTYTLTDDGDPAQSDAGEVTLVVEPVNDAPEVQDLSAPAQVQAQEPATFDFVVVDPDAGDTVALAAGQPTCPGGRVLAAGADADGGQVTCVWPEAGEATVTVAVDDAAGASSPVESLELVVEAAPPPPPPAPPRDDEEPPGGAPGPDFPDVAAGHPFADAIDWAQDRGITTGYGDGTFRPGAVATRQAVAAMLFRLAGESLDAPEPQLRDVAASHPFAEPLAWLARADLLEGFPDGSIRPGTVMTRQALAGLLHRAAGAPEAEAGPAFADVGDDHPFATAIAWVHEQGLASGYPGGDFRPGAAVTRQAAVALLRALPEEVREGLISL